MTQQPSCKCLDMYREKLLRKITDLGELQVRTKELHVIDHGRLQGFIQVSLRPMKSCELTRLEALVCLQEGYRCGHEEHALT